MNMVLIDLTGEKSNQAQGENSMDSQPISSSQLFKKKKRVSSSLIENKLVLLNRSNKK